MTARHSSRATRALRQLAETDPAFASLSLWITHSDSDARADPAWSDDTTIHYGPGFEALSLAEQMGLAGHHILHIAFRHAARARSMHQRFGPGHDPRLFNLASDAVLNEAILRAGYILPRPAVLLTDLLREALSETASPDDALAKWDTDKLYVRLLTDPGQTGREGASGRARAFAERQGFGQDLDTGNGEDTETDPSGEWRQRIARAMEAGRLAGRGIGTVGNRLADLPEARTPWEVILRRLVSRAVTELPRQSWQRPTGRWLALDSAGQATPFEPGTRRDGRAPRIAVAIDSSGSIDETRLALFTAQVAGIARRTGAETHVLVFDHEVHDRRVIRPGDWSRPLSDLALTREGGTNFDSALRAADAVEPAIIVVLTDLEGPASFRPRSPVIWAVPEVEPSAPFGRVLSLAA